MLSELSQSAHTSILAEIEGLVRETYTLWDENWVGFSWRNYTYEHVQRVRSLARSITQAEGGDVLVVDYAGLLHDITKSYDGEIIMKDGKRVLDENGFWKNDVLPPARQNEVTRLYDELDLGGALHNISGAIVADRLLERRGVSAELREKVAGVIKSHLKPGDNESVEERALYDADTLDANVGLPAFYRNIQINLHFGERQYASRGESIDAYLQEKLDEYLSPYLTEKIPAWINGKHNDFISRMTTEAGRQMGLARIERLSVEIGQAAKELEDFGQNVERGRLAIVRRFMMNRQNPALSEELEYLAGPWRRNVQPTPSALGFLESFIAEQKGIL